MDGQKIRDEINVDFVNGGNEAVYPDFIPPGEIWIDDAQHVIDRTGTALHELVERDLMLHHHVSYEPAHDSSNVYERALRKRLVQHPPTMFDTRSVAAVYHDYLREGRIPKTSRQLDRDIEEVLGRKVRR